MFDLFLGKLYAFFFVPAVSDELMIKRLILLPKAPIWFLKSDGAGVDPFWDLKKEGADFFEIVFIGAGSATMVILAVGVIPGDARQEA